MGTSADMNVNELARFLFVNNEANRRVIVNLADLECTKDLFCFCFDMMCKGLVILFGTDNRVSLNQITLDQFEVVRKKMQCVGIDTFLKVFPVEPPPTPLDFYTQNMLNMHQVMAGPVRPNLEDYTFKIQTMDMMYNITFKVLPIPIDEIPHNHAWL
jgi:hypothetical protein